MSDKKHMQAKLENLRADYQQLMGKPFSHFFCPILYRDEASELIKGHIVNEAFPDTVRYWTVQRKDVDNFYGAFFEADFLDLQHKDKAIEEILTDNQILKRFTHNILLDDKPVDHYVARDENEIPYGFTPLKFESDDGQSILFGLKMSPEDVHAAVGQKWEVDISKDVSLQTLVSLIKAAHLTLFETVGYRYALSSGGHFVGHDILGEFFLQNRNKRKPEILISARNFFRQYAHMVRPVESEYLQGTITDKTICICQGYDGPHWSLIVFLKTSQMLHAVMLPYLHQQEAVVTFLGFLHNPNESLELNFIRLGQNPWEIDPNSVKMNWPKAGISLL